MASFIGEARHRFWEENGFLVLPGFFTYEEVDTIRSAERRAWESLPPHVVVDDMDANRRCRIDQLSAEERSHRFKVNDLYLSDEGTRHVSLSRRVGMVLGELLGDQPVICNTLNFAQGSQQADHLDTLYMTPVSQRGLVATWMALEDTVAEAGPLRYYPGSNHIEPYTFETGSMHVNLPEMPRWADYMASQVSALGLEEQRFMARKGDLFIWHALLLHGGSEICEPGLTRESLVTHFYTLSDSKRLQSDLRPAPGGWWICRPPQQVPAGEVPALQDDTGMDLTMPRAADRRGVASAGRELRERMEPLLSAID